MSTSMPSIKRVAILATNGFEQSELMEPRRRLKEAGFTVQVVSPKGPQIRGWKDKDWGEHVDVDAEMSSVSPNDYDALVLPGGVINPDALRADADAVAFIRAFDEAGKPLAAICHGPWLLVEADAVRGRTVTSYASIRTDVKNAGGNWVDREVAVDKGIITSRSPADLKAFVAKIIEEIGEGRHERKVA